MYVSVVPSVSLYVYAVHIHQTACKNKQIKVITVAPKLSIVYSSRETVRTNRTVDVTVCRSRTTAFLVFLVVEVVKEITKQRASANGRTQATVHGTRHEGPSNRALSAYSGRRVCASVLGALRSVGRILTWRERLDG